MDKENFTIVQPFVIDDGFFRVGVNGYKKRVKILDPSTHKPYIFNKFTITISENFSKNDPMFLVKEVDSVPFQLGDNISFSFKLYISRFDNPPPETDYLSLVIFICAFASFISVVFFFLYFRSKGISITIIHLTDIWRIGLYFQNTVLMSSAGLTYIFTITIYLLFFYTNSPIDFYRFTNIGMLSNAISVFAYGWICFFMSKKLFIPEHVSIELIFNSFSLIPFIVVSLFNKLILNCNTGIGIFKSILILISILSITFLISISSFEFSQLFFEKRLPIKPREVKDRNFLQQLLPSLKNLVQFLFLAVSFFFILKPAIDHCFLCFIDDYYFDPYIVVSFLLLYVGIIALISLSRAYFNINKFNNSWQSNHLTLNLIVATVVAIYLLGDILLVRDYLFNYETLLYCGAYLVSFIPAVMLIGMTPSLYTNFIFFGFIYQSNDKEENGRQAQN